LPRNGGGRYERGIAVEQRESNPDMSCVAAPVRDSAGQVVAALSISVPMIRWSEERLAELKELAVKGAAELSERLGHRGRVL
jgi:DNA-binding IclR family transcriptional regulator